MKTYTPTLDPAVLDRLREYAALFADEFPQAKPAAWAGVYLQGLLLDGERKSIEPLSHRVRLPEGLTSKDPEQALQQFVNQSPWDDKAVLRRYRAHLAPTFASPEGIFLFDDVSFPKQGTHSVGVQRQYCGALGKKANCQVAVSAHYVGPKGHYPLDVRLYLPDAWLKDGKRLNKVGIPKDQRRSVTKPEIALELLDRVRAEGLPGRFVVADAGYGVSGPFRAGLEQRGLTYIVGVNGDFVVFTEQPTWDRPTAGPSGPGRPRTRPQLAPNSPRPVTLSELAARTRRHRVGWREGTKGTLSEHFAWVRVWPAHGWKTGECADEKPLWVLVEKQGEDGPLKFAFSNRPAGTSRIAAVRLWKSRWPVEQGYQQLKEELGLDHFEGRSWRGFHHHAAMTLLAYGFLLLERDRLGAERDRANRTRPERVKKGAPNRP
ncbi:Transposase DDE domain protein [Gemmata obscuriglobus]|uniref:Transposase n=1 Tax=Gemmata obscuriglobus TaxID=114 RepID=A0A2Z3H6Y2_9BACT|nr:IS701 family transposase [Gemmata obscuriglobus]AWM36740.1 transposase [Gemmata obscuriglobus]QEG30605.1 Transposase DDE domain protein [Gemmata obscuriglobus]VTS09929.1 transposase : ISXo8 transposase OS=Xanthomonas oryzae pv. oryzae (strain PXO99A) GN=PXO_03028 PE=4 SV=1: DDE_5 [Gemmata obscuriglobus UQM 2246]